MALSEAHAGTIEVNGVAHAYEVRGRGEPVVLLHGGWLRMEQWDPQIDEFARAFRVLRYDARAYGRTPIGEAPYSLHDDLAKLMRAVGMPSAHLVALSNGSTIALDLALTEPAMVRSLCVGAHPMRGVDMSDEFVTGIRGVIAAGCERNKPALRERLWAFAPFRVASQLPAARAALDRMIVEENEWLPNCPGAPKRQMADPAAAGRLGEIAMPTLIVVGDGEMDAFLAQADYMAARIPGVRRVVIEGAGHVVNMEKPDEYARVVGDWLRGHATRVN